MAEHDLSVQAPILLSELTDEAEETFEYDGEVPSPEQLETVDVEDGEPAPSYGDDEPV